MMAAAIFGIVSIGGCSGPSVIVMRNPQTAELIQCKTSYVGTTLTPLWQAVADSKEAKGCADGYQAAGWQRMN